MKIEEYDGHPVGELATGMLGPAVENVGSMLDEGNMEGALEAYQRLIHAGNACHLVTEHAFVKIADRSDYNPYMQAFE